MSGKVGRLVDGGEYFVWGGYSLEVEYLFLVFSVVVDKNRIDFSIELVCGMFYF